MFLQVSVCPGEGACVAGGVHGRGTCMVGGMHGRACAWQGACMEGGVWQGGYVWWGACMAGDICGTHAPTPSPRQILRDTVIERAVSILLECILVMLLLSQHCYVNGMSQKPGQNKNNMSPHSWLLYVVFVSVFHLPQIDAR